MREQQTALQAEISNHFARLIANKQLVHAYLLTGAKGIGKRELAMWIAQGIFCQENHQGQPCLVCSECQRIQNEQHPDVVMIAPQGLSIKVDQIRYLKAEFSKSGVESKRKIFIIEDAEKMTVNAANSLLKFLEEPSGEVTAFLLTSHLNQILPTIVSRCQLVEVPALTKEQLKAKLTATGNFTKNQVQLLSQLTDSEQAAQELGSKEGFLELVETLWQWFYNILRNKERSFVDVQVSIMPYVNDRQDQELILELISLLARDMMLVKYQRYEEVAFVKYLDKLEDVSLHLKPEQIVNGVELVLTTPKQLKMNITLQNILEHLTLKLSECYHS